MGWKPIREVKIVDDLVYVPLTKGYVAVVDLADLDKVKPFNWHAIKKRNVVYARRSVWRDGKDFNIEMQRFIIEPQEGKVCDHIDGDGLNNRRSNLRLCTAKENTRNSRVSKSNTSGAKGVNWDKRDKNWKAQIQVDGKNIYLGNYKDIDLAANAYAEASKKYFGEFARV